jgi:arylsulfatase A-like enzyme
VFTIFAFYCFRWRLSDRLVDRARTFIAEHAASDHSNKAVSPFLLYMPLVHTHIPHTPKKKFIRASMEALKLKSSEHPSESLVNSLFKQSKPQKKVVLSTEEIAVYGASLREADDMTKQVLGALEAAGGSVYHNTLTIVTSDNGPWLIQVKQLLLFLLFQLLLFQLHCLTTVFFNFKVLDMLIDV